MKKEAVSPPKRDRRKELTMAAFHAIAGKGFEGLRIREVAAEVGINGATLHHYFPTKEDLIHSVVEYAILRLRGTMAGGWPAEASSASSPTTSTPSRKAERTPPEQLHDHITKLYQLMQNEPDLFIVLTEVNLRARRTPILDFLLEQHHIWHGILMSILKEGVAEHYWPESLDISATAANIITLMEGVSSWADTSPDWGRKAVQQLERWLGIE